jgi:hypothetical protein
VATLASGTALQEQFPDELARRAAEHICAHAADPTAELPADDPSWSRSSPVF